MPPYRVHVQLSFEPVEAASEACAKQLVASWLAEVLDDRPKSVLPFVATRMRAIAIDPPAAEQAEGSQD